MAMLVHSKSIRFGVRVSGRLRGKEETVLRRLNRDSLDSHDYLDCSNHGNPITSEGPLSRRDSFGAGK